MGPCCLNRRSLNTHPHHCILPFSPPFLPPVHFEKSATMLLAQEAIHHLDYPVHPLHEPGIFTADELQELLFLFQSSPTSSQNSGSDGSNRAAYSQDEKKRRRMISNRESARRSRWRKKRHLQDLTEEVNRLKIQKQQLKNRLGSVLNQFHILCTENNRLIAESVALQARLSDLHHCLVALRSTQQQNINNYQH